MAVPFSYPRGEDIVINLVIADPGDYDPATLTVTMSLKVTYNLQPPPVTVAPTATFVVTYHPISGSDPAYWQGVISSTVSAGLTPGSYITDALILSGSTVLSVTSPQIINVVESVTPAA